MIIKVDLIKSAIRSVSSTISESSKDSTSYFQIKSYKDQIYLCGNQGYLFSMYPLGFKKDYGEKFESFSIPAKRFKQWVSSIPDSSVELIWDSEEKLVRAKSSHGEVTFTSLEMSFFPSWEYILENSDKKGTVVSSNIYSALYHVKHFLYQDETQKPQFCIASLKDGFLQGTDLGGLSFVSVPGSDSCDSTFFNQNISNTLKWLKAIGESSPVEVWEHEKAHWLRSPDGSIFCEIEISIKYGGPPVQNITSPNKILLDKEKLKKAIKYLWSVADWNQIFIDFKVEENSLILETDSETKKKANISLPLQEKEFSEELPSSLKIMKEYFSKIIKLCPDSSTEIGIVNKGGKGGFLVFSHLKNENQFTTLMSWKPE